MSAAARGARVGMAVALAIGLAAVAPSAARADSGALFGESSRAAALADAVTARPGGLRSLGFNPGALGDMERPELSVLAHGGRIGQWWKRPGESKEDLSRRIAGFGIGIAAPLPAPLSAIRVGGAVHVPSRYALRLVAPQRADVPSAPLYGDRAERTAFTLGAAASVLGRFQVGIALSLAPTLFAPTRVEYLAARDGETEGRLTVDVERELRIGLSWSTGIRYEIVEHRLALGFAYHQPIVTRATGTNLTQAGLIVTRQPIDFYDFLEPEKLAWGAFGRPIDRLGLSADVVWQRWSAFRTIHHEVPLPGFSDTVVLRLGADFALEDWLILRAGYAYEPSPVPPQIATTNFLDADRHVLAFGAGLDFARFGLPDLRVDAHVRAHVAGRQTVTKDVGELDDANPTTPYLEVANLGYPGFEARTWFLQGGVTVTVLLGSGGARP